MKKLWYILPISAAVIVAGIYGSGLCTDCSLSKSQAVTETKQTSGIDQNWLAGVTQDLAKSEYFIRYQEENKSYQSPNRSQNLRITYGENGFSMKPRVGDKASWNVSLKLASVSKGAAKLPIDKPEIQVQDNRMNAKFADFTRRINREDEKADVPMTRMEFDRYRDSAIGKSGVRLTPTGFSSKEAYDSALHSGKKKHNWVMRQLVYKQIDLNKKYNNDSRLIVRAFMDKIMHSLPQMLFVSLPFFALLLKWLYFRNKSLFYVDHLVFTVHFYIFSFFAMFIMYAITKINNQFDFGFLRLINFLLFLGMLFYEYKAMRKFYMQGRGKTIAKFLLLNLSFIVFMVLIFAFFVIFSFFKI